MCKRNVLRTICSKIRKFDRFLNVQMIKNRKAFSYMIKLKNLSISTSKAFFGHLTLGDSKRALLRTSSTAVHSSSSRQELDEEAREATHELFIRLAEIAIRSRTRDANIVSCLMSDEVRANLNICRRRSSRVLPSSNVPVRTFFSQQCRLQQYLFAINSATRDLITSNVSRVEFCRFEHYSPQPVLRV